FRGAARPVGGLSLVAIWSPKQSGRSVRSGLVSGSVLVGTSMVLTVAPREFVVTLMFSCGTSAGLAYPVGPWTAGSRAALPTMARNNPVTPAAMMAFAVASRFHGRSSGAAHPSYSPITMVVSY